MENPEKLYYPIGEVAEILGVNASAIRFWEKEFDIIQPKRTAKGNRLFYPKDLENLKRIKHLTQNEGYTLDGAKQYFKNNKKTDNLDKNLLIIQKLEAIKAELFKLG